MAYKVELYIGAPNDTHKVDNEYLDKVIRWAEEHIPDGFTVVEGHGYYGGLGEDCIVLTVLSEKSPDFLSDDTIGQLKQTLGQETILVTLQPIGMRLV